MTTEARRQLSNAKARAWRKKHKAQEAARARRWRKAHPNYAGKYVAKSRGIAAPCCCWLIHELDWLTRQCRNWTRHESGLCWRHRA